MELRGELDPERPLLVVAAAQEAAELSTELPILVTGVGKVAAGQAVLATLGPRRPERRPQSIVNLGTAGALHAGYAGTHVVGTVIQHDLDRQAIIELTGDDPAPPLTVGEGPTLATGDRFISDPAERDRLSQVAQLVDMEGYAVVRAARLLGLRAMVVKHISDHADDGAAARWVDEVAACSAALGSWLASGGLEHAQTTMEHERGGS